MKQEQVTIGMQARVKIGSRLAEVVVLHEIDRGGYKLRRLWQCRTCDTGRLIKATAARLRPMPTPAVRAMVDRMVAAVADRDVDAIVLEPSHDLAAWASCPVGAY